MIMTYVKLGFYVSEIQQAMVHEAVTPATTVTM